MSIRTPTERTIPPEEYYDVWCQQPKCRVYRKPWRIISNPWYLKYDCIKCGGRMKVELVKVDVLRNEDDGADSHKD